jgi:hypothetical protein
MRTVIPHGLKRSVFDSAATAFFCGGPLDRLRVGHIEDAEMFPGPNKNLRRLQQLRWIVYVVMAVVASRFLA